MLAEAADLAWMKTSRGKHWGSGALVTIDRDTERYAGGRRGVEESRLRETTGYTVHMKSLVIWPTCLPCLTWRYSQVVKAID